MRLGRWLATAALIAMLSPAAAALEGPGEYTRLARDAARRHGLDHSLVIAIMRIESGFNPRALSPKGAMGLMQLMPDTARRFGVRDPYDPAQNIRGGCAYLAWLLDRYDGDVVLAAAAYNAGEAAVDEYGGVPPYQETRAYVAALTGEYSTRVAGRARTGSGLTVQWNQRRDGSRPLFQRPQWGGGPSWR